MREGRSAVIFGLVKCPEKAFSMSYCGIIGAAILFSCHPYIGTHYCSSLIILSRLPLITIVSNYNTYSLSLLLRRTVTSEYLEANHLYLSSDVYSVCAKDQSTSH